MERVSDVKKYICLSYPLLPSSKFEVVKIGVRIYIYLVDKNGDLQREQIFRGALPSVNEEPVLRRLIENNIKQAIKKWGYVM